MRLRLTAGQTHDTVATPALLAGLKCRHIVADRSYDARSLLDLIKATGAQAHIATQRDRLVQRSVNRRLYRQRNLVERYFNKLKHFRRIATRFDKLARNFLAGWNNLPSSPPNDQRLTLCYTGLGKAPRRTLLRA